MTPSLSFCGHEVYTHDRDRFLTVLSLPEIQRETLFALYAFNLEISRIPEIVSEEMIGHIRFAWWREALDELYAGKPGRNHPVVQALKPLIPGLTRAHFDRFLQARQNQFVTPGFATLTDMQAHGEDTAGALLTLCLEATGGADEKSMETARQLGIAYTVLGHARAVPYHASQGKVYLPQALLERHGLTVEDVLAGPAPQLADVLRDMTQLSAPSAPGQGKRMLQPVRLLLNHWRRGLKRSGYNPYDSRCEQGRGRLALALAFSNVMPWR